MIRKCYIRHRESLPDNAQHYASLTGFHELGVEVVPFYGFGDIDGLDDLGPEVGIHGFVGDTFAALKLIGMPLPEPIDYPEELRGFLQRRVWQTTLDAVTSGGGMIVGNFIKPVRHKLFTGRVWTGSIADRLATEGTPGVAADEPVWCSHPVNFVAEFRCFVLDDKVLDVRRYKGDWSKAPDRHKVARAVMAYSSAPVAYALDWGVTDDGMTLLVEVNDAFALGAYGMDPVLYARMISARWEQLASK
jgi:hypothetical protein